jgi:hypothetical protein
MTCLSQQYFESFDSLDSLLETVPTKHYLAVGTGPAPHASDLLEVTVFFEQRHKVRGKRTRSPFAKLVFYKPAGWDGV